jgi:hypothetical protein
MAIYSYQMKFENCGLVHSQEIISKIQIKSVLFLFFSMERFSVKRGLIKLSRDL